MFGPTLTPIDFGGDFLSYLLDDLAGTIAIASMRRLSRNQNSWGVVRKASEELTIGFDGQWIDADSLLDFAGSSDVFVKTIYDASGNGNDFTQSTTTKQPKILSSGSPILTEYAGGLSFDGSDDFLASPSIAFGSEVSALLAVHTATGADKLLLSSGTTVGGTQQNWYAPLLNGTSLARVGTVDSGPSYDLYERAMARAGYGGLFNPACTPIFNVTASAIGWTRTHTQVASGAFSNQSAYLCGHSTAGTNATAKLGGFAVLGRILTSDEIIAIAKAIGIAASGVVIGDSTIAAYSGTTEVAAYVLRGADHLRSHGIKSIANPGDTIANQKTAWQALATRSLAEWVVIQIGLNDMDPATATATTIAALQDLVDTVRADNANCKIIAATMIPAYERWPYLGYNQANAQAKWVAVNDSIMGRGASPLTGVDGRIEQHTIDLSKDVSGNAALADAYDTGDHIHENNAGRAIIGGHYRTKLGQLRFF